MSVTEATTKTILITGADGQVGREFRRLLETEKSYKVFFTNRQQLAIDDVASVDSFFQENNINHCINCAAYTAVDRAEAEPDLAFRINGTAVGYLAEACKNHCADFYHLSTDYVYSGKSTKPYKEDDPVDPTNVYGASKLLGEELALAKNPETTIIRTSWVYSEYGNNFVKTMVKLMNEKDSINVVDDQKGSPTYAADIAKMIWTMITSVKENKGVFNYANNGAVTWFQFALAIKDLISSNCIVNPTTSDQFKTTATRPSFSVMNTKKIQSILPEPIPTWNASLQSCLHRFGLVSAHK
ncbi:MAG: dTDP-4-dehydrorhamnose reductase [Ginsengibacter sp.]